MILPLKCVCRMPWNLRYWTAGLLLLFLLNATSPAAGDEHRPLFDSDKTMLARVEGPLTTIMRDRSETEYRDARFTYIDAAGAEQELKVKLRTRGVYRRRKDVCDFAPLRLNFRVTQQDVH